MLREKKCKTCERYFYYDDGIDSHGVAVSASSLSNEVTQPRRAGYCPHCVDPNSVAGETYKKETLIRCFRRHLFVQHIRDIDDETLMEMLKDFPIAYNLYYGTSYKTFTLYTGITFNNGDFSIGAVIKRRFRKMILCDRQIICNRCHKITMASKKKTLLYFVNFHTKRCATCDPLKHKRVTIGLRQGSRKRDNSARARAKRLNISVNDLKRKRIREYQAPLVIGTIVNGLEVIEAYWDENPNIYAPKYRIRCVKCKRVFECIQKRILEQEHICKLS